MLFIAIAFILGIIYPEKVQAYLGGFLGIYGFCLLIELASMFFFFGFEYWVITGILAKIWAVAGIIVCLFFI